MSEPLRGSEWMRASDLYPRLRSLRSFSLGLLRVCLRGTVCNPPSAYLDALATRKPLSPNVGVGFIPIRQAQPPSSSHLDGDKGNTFKPLEDGDKPHPTLGSEAPFTSDSTEQSLKIPFYTCKFFTCETWIKHFPFLSKSGYCILRSYFRIQKTASCRGRTRPSFR